MDGRIKVQRMDRNGVLVSRWVKPEISKRKPVGSIPPASLASPPKRTELIRNVRNALEDILMVRREGLDGALSLRTPDEMLIELQTVLTDPNSPSWNSRFSIAQHVVTCLESPKDRTVLISRVIRHFGDLPDPVNEYTGMRVLSGMDKYGDDLTTEQERALLLVTHEASNVLSGVMLTPTKPSLLDEWVLVDSQLAELVLSRPDQCHEIAAIIRDWNTTNGLQIRNIIEGTLHASVVSGAL